MTVARDSLDTLLTTVVQLLPVGRDAAIRGAEIAAELHVSERTIRMAVDELVDRGWLIGSVCSGERPGYFRCHTPDDVEAGCGHLVSRARSLYRRVGRLRDAAAVQFGDSPEVLRLFDLEEVPA